MTSARIYDSWEEQQAATQKVAALARRSTPDDLLSDYCQSGHLKEQMRRR